MKFTSPPIPILIGILTLLIWSGCSRSASNPTTPDEYLVSEANVASEVDGHGVIGLYDLVFDPETTTIDVVEVRDAAAHYNITKFLAPHVSTSLVSWDPTTLVVEFELSLTNPSMLDVFDVRTLFLAEPSSGYELLNPDDYTPLFNPFTSVMANPFRAYAKSSPDRLFAAGATHTEMLSVQTPPTYSPSAKLLVECSWPGNCEEAYEISNQEASHPLTTTMPCTVTLDVFDHQGDVSAVTIDTTPLTGGLTNLVKTGEFTWEGEVFNAEGAAPGVYHAWIAAENLANPYILADLVPIFVGPIVIIPKWHSTGYPIDPGDCSFDLGVIADPGGPRDSEILMADGGSEVCDAVTKYDPYYAGQSNYVDLMDYDAANLNYQPYPVVRIDAADDGAFSFTNSNVIDPYPDAASGILNYQVWSVFDNLPMLHTGPVPDEARYFFNLVEHDAISRPIDVADDFSLGQYAIFSTGVEWSPRDILVVGTMPNSYTFDEVRYIGNLDGWTGMGDALVNPAAIIAIDVYQVEYAPGGQTNATVYILEEYDTAYQVEVFRIFDSAPGWIEDFVIHLMTIDVHLAATGGVSVVGHDIELLPVNESYMEDSTDIILSVLVSYELGVEHGEVVLYDAFSGTLLESIGDLMNPALPKSEVYFLDTDDDDWEIHVTNTDESGNNIATVFNYS